ncbi:unnamed protein product, partial [Musa hybrid cultivar]
CASNSTLLWGLSCCCYCSWPLAKEWQLRWRRQPTPPALRGCWYQPWIFSCLYQENERNTCCVDTGADVNNCGLCGIRCPFRRWCCNGLCIDVMANPLRQPVPAWPPLPVRPV